MSGRPSAREALVAGAAVAAVLAACAVRRAARDSDGVAASLPKRGVTAGPVVVLLSGKRMVGKDTVADAIIEACARKGLTARRFALADACKIEFARTTADINVERLLTNRKYKEMHRAAMTEWFHRELAIDEDAFRKIVAHQIAAASGTDVCIVSDARLLRDVAYFEELNPAAGAGRSAPQSQRLLKVRVQARESTRSHRGWAYDHTTDTDATECALDEFDRWDAVVHNDGSRAELASVAERELLSRITVLLR